MSRAAVLTGFGDERVLRSAEVVVPAPGPRQVRIAVELAGVGPTDLDIRAGHLSHVFPTPPGSVLGFEVAGTVESVGDDVADVAVGDAVAAYLPALGGYAELALADHWVHKPERVSWEDAAALPASGEAAGRVLHQLDVRGGQTLLVLGSSGSVGLVAVQLAVARGARVLAAVREPARSLLESLGATPVAVGSDLAEQVRTAGPVDAVLDAASTSDLREAVELAGGPEHVITLSNHDAPSLGVRLSGPDPSLVGTSLQEAMGALADGRLTLRHHEVLPLDAAGEAHRRIASGERVKLLLRP